MKKHSITALFYDKRGRLLAIGQNSYVKTHPLQARFAAHVGEPDKIFLHAEIAGLLKIKDWSKIDKVVITRFTKDGCPALAAPCRCCSHALAIAGITNIQTT